MTALEEERRRRWRLVLGGGVGDARNDGHDLADAGQALPSEESRLSGIDARRDALLSSLFGAEGDETTLRGVRRSARRVAVMLEEFDACFPASSARVLRREAIDRLKLQKALLDPGVMATLKPDLTLAADIAALAGAAPEPVRREAWRLVRRAVDKATAKIEPALTAPVARALAAASGRSRSRKVDWSRTLKTAMARAQIVKSPDGEAKVIPQRFFHQPSRRARLCDLIICLDRSGSMRPSFAAASVVAAALARLPQLRVRLLAFDDRIVDLTGLLDDPVDILFAADLGGCTDIAGALDASSRLIDDPARTILALISDLRMNDAVASRPAVSASAARLIALGVKVRIALALSSEGFPRHDEQNRRRSRGARRALFRSVSGRVRTRDRRRRLYILTQRRRRSASHIRDLPPKRARSYLVIEKINAAANRLRGPLRKAARSRRER